MLDLLIVDRDHLKATVGNMLFMIWRERTLAPAYKDGIAAVRRLAASHPEGVGVCNIVEVGASPPDADARAVFIDFHRLPEVRHMSVIHEGAGFKAASVRAIMAGVQAVTKPKFAHCVQKSLDEGARWHAQQQRALGLVMSGDEIAAVARKLRSVHDSRFPAAGLHAR